MELSSQWETVSTDEGYETKRLKVAGGWIVSVRDATYSTSSIIFVPDPLHDVWELVSEVD